MTSSFAKPPKQEPEKKAAPKKMMATERPATSMRQRSGSASRQKPEEIKAPVSKLGLTRPATAAIGSLKKQESVETFVIQVGQKSKRADFDKRNAWVITDKIRDDYLEKLKTDVKTCFGEEMSKKMWATDFNKHCQCLDML